MFVFAILAALLIQLFRRHCLKLGVIVKWGWKESGVPTSRRDGVLGSASLIRKGLLGTSHQCATEAKPKETQELPVIKLFCQHFRFSNNYEPHI